MVADRIDIIYFTDPLCCWSWAMEPQWRTLIFQYKEHLTWSYCMGGLIPSWTGYVDNINSVSRAAQMGPMWLHAERASGMPMGSEIWTRRAPTSSFPSCIAVKCANSQSPRFGEIMLRKLREFCHLNNRDISDKLVIYEAAKELASENTSFGLGKFLIDFNSETGLDYFRVDWDETRRRDVARFPTLFLTKTGVGTIQLSGYRSLNNIKGALFQLDPSLQDVEPNKNLSLFREFWVSVIAREESEFITESVAQV